MSEPMVKAESVRKRFGRLEVLKGIKLEVAPSEVVCMIGPSGSGKSTFLRCINHLEKIDGGRLWVDGELVGYRQKGDKLYELRESEVARKRAEIGMVFQRFNLFPHMTALGNVIEAPIAGQGRRARRGAWTKAGELLDRVGLADKADDYPARLSGGQQQRVAIARALAMEPEADAVRRGHQRARPRAGRGGARRDARAGRRGHDDDRRHPRDGLRPRGRRPGRLHGRRRDRRGGAGQAGDRHAAARAHQALPRARSWSIEGRGFAIGLVLAVGVLAGSRRRRR